MTQQRIHQNKIELFTDSKETAQAIQDEFSAFEPGYEQNTKYRMGLWNGRQNFYHVKVLPEGWMFFIPLGFKGRVEQFTKEKFPGKLNYTRPYEFYKKLLPELPFTPYDHQLKMFLGLASRKNHLGVASVGAGKSMVLYMLVRYYKEINPNLKILCLVPTIDLVNQLKDDFSDYKCSQEFLNSIQQVGGEFKNKNIHKSIVISTWQSADKVDLSDFDIVLNDEVHLSKADVLMRILSNPFKIKLGLTGTPPIEKLDAMLLEQNFGSPRTYINAKGLIELGLATDLSVVPIFLHQKQKIMKYQEEVKFIKESPKRKEWVKNFLKKLTGVSIALYAHTAHGHSTWESLTSLKATPKNLNDFELQKKLGVFFMSGGTKAQTRKQILDYFKSLSTESVILIGQQKILSTGINIKPLKNLVFLSSSKSYTQVIQSIGRVLRLHSSKTKALVFDLVDDFSQGRKTENYALRHFWYRLSFYEMQGFECIEKEVQL